MLAGARKVAEKLLKKEHMPIEKVAQLTGLSEKEIKEIEE